MKKIREIFKRYGAAFALGFIFAVVCFVILNAVMVPLSAPAFCASYCHEMKPAYRSWELSRHASNTKGVQAECIDCHLPPKEKFFLHLATKAYVGAKDNYLHFFGGPYNQQAARQKVLDELPNERCLHCHDNLLATPGSASTLIAHRSSLNRPDDPDYACVKCHYNLHQREKTIFTPD